MVACGCSASGCSNSDKAKRAGEAGVSIPGSNPLAGIAVGTADVEGAQVVERTSQGTVWTLRSPQMGIEMPSQVSTVKNVDATLYEAGRPSIRVRSPEAAFDREQGVLELRRGVVAQSLLYPERFTADRIVWRWQERNGLDVSGHVHFEKGATVVTAGRLVADVELKAARLSENPVARVKESGA